MLSYAMFTSFSVHMKKPGRKARATQGDWPYAYTESHFYCGISMYKQHSYFATCIEDSNRQPNQVAQNGGSH